VNIGPSACDLEIYRLKELYLDPNDLDVLELPTVMVIVCSVPQIGAIHHLREGKMKKYRKILTLL
jgi:hypothetical protein